MKRSLKNDTVSRHVPAHVGNPIQLVARILRSGSAEARSALYLAMAGILATPLDMLLSRRESRIYGASELPDLPIILVAGPPRSGTTLVGQSLINRFDVCYLNNLTSLFPRSPISSLKLFSRAARPRTGSFKAYYGKSKGLAGANDGLHIWDRWLGYDRSKVPTALSGDAEETMRGFFAALLNIYNRPLVNKVNRLNTCANLVAKVLPNAKFICLQRDPLYLAQSLLIARSEIVGDSQTPYGTEHDKRVIDDPIEDVCQQVLFHEGVAARQREYLGASRFMTVSYESFCQNPEQLISVLKGCESDLNLRQGPKLEPFRVSQAKKLPADTIRRLDSRLAGLGVGRFSEFCF